MPSLKLTASQEASIVDAMPGLARELVAVVGLTPVLQLLRSFGGSRRFLPKTAPWPAEIRQAIGDDATTKMQKYLGGAHIELPRAAGVERLLRDNSIRADFDAGESLNALACRHHTTQRYIRRILGEPLASDALCCAPGWERDPIGGLLHQIDAHVLPLPSQHHSHQSAAPVPCWQYARFVRLAQGYMPRRLTP
ncbi:MAG: hypothetical protein JNK55_20300 [Rubrivivax sp.]|nr:hypothetical protein [Rubrivivax sp.]